MLCWCLGAAGYSTKASDYPNILSIKSFCRTEKFFKVFCLPLQWRRLVCDEGDKLKFSNLLPDIPQTSKL